MSRLTLILVALFGVVGGAVGSAYYFQRAPARTNVAEVRAIVSSMLADTKAKSEPSRENVAQLDPKTLDPLIENYLIGNPQILQRMSDALTSQAQAARLVKTRAAISANKASIYQNPAVVLGNPKGDVTLVEMFDYNCSYCRAALPDLATLISEDPKLRVILKQFPILTAGSVDAARVALEVAKTGADYWTFHQALFSSRGEVDGQTALDEAKTLGLDPAKLKAGMEAPAISAQIQKNYTLAKNLGVSGTPTYIIGDDLIPGAVPIAQLRTAIANMRACGSAQCPAPEKSVPVS